MSGKTIEKTLNEEFLSAVQDKDINKIEESLNLGADVQTNNNLAIRIACQEGDFEIVKLLIEHKANIHVGNITSRGDAPLIAAATNGDIEIVKLLLDNGADVQAEGNAALRQSALNGHLRMVKFLMARGADCSATNNYMLKFAAKNSDLELLKILMEHNANMDIIKKYASPTTKQWLSSSSQLDLDLGIEEKPVTTKLKLS